MHSMKCENDKEMLTVYMNNQMTDAERTAFENHLAGCAECRQELDANLHIWNLMEDITVPEPSDKMQVRFNAMLDTYQDSVNEKKNAVTGIIEKIRQVFTLQPAFILAYSVILIIAGLGVGLLLNRPPKPIITVSESNAGRGPIDSLATQVHEMKQMVMLALLQNPSASERIKGVSYTSEITGANKEVINALFTTLNNDPNTNVRLMTLEALTRYANDPAVREGLVQSIVQQDSPLMQSALADAMLKLQEKRSVQPFKKLLQQKSLNNMVRGKIEETITRLI